MKKRATLNRLNQSSLTLLVDTDITMNSTLWLGTFPALGSEQLDFIAEKMEEFFGVNF